MSAVKILEQKSVIRLFGLALILAPFINLSLMIYYRQQDLHVPWNIFPFRQVFFSGSLTSYTLILVSFLIGINMLRGSRTSWKYTLILLGSLLILQTPHIGSDIRNNWRSGIMFVINLVLFVFIADQLFFRSKKELDLEENSEQSLTTIQPPSPSQSAIKVPPYLINKDLAKPSIATSTKKPFQTFSSVKKNIQIQFDEFKTQGQLTHVSDKVLQIRFNTEINTNLEAKAIELSFKSGLTIKITYKNKLENKYFFDITSMNPKQSEQYFSWVSQITS